MPRDHLRRAVLDLLWEYPDGLTAAEVQQLLADRELALTTVITVLDRLRAEGEVDRERHGRAYRHRTTRSREETVAKVMLEALHTGGDSHRALSRFVDSVNPAEASLLSTALLTRCACGPECGCPADCACRGTGDPTACTAHPGTVHHH
ncbi:putative transcriptional regulator [Propionibacteriaceae bacterium ES.041]|nr:BlaI/MecI/CopY family transcriptional regulator [Enemella evansiae]OYN96360.1 hypothetical protein CGZ96_13980 [Enemella evansiae]OYO10950.1 hypothetical protein CGZ98_09975 [Enemella evansiae]PFG65604.1 putative transcriptional regulator [Propionibacteriaceae bacterium ES.041]